MKAHVTFVRDEACEHSPDRECTPCFKDGIADFMGSAEAMEEAWKNRSMADEAHDDLVDSLTVYYGIETLTMPVITVPVETDPQEVEKQRKDGGTRAEVVSTFRNPDAPPPENLSSGGPYR